MCKQEGTVQMKVSCTNWKYQASREALVQTGGFSDSGWEAARGKGFGLLTAKGTKKDA